MGIRTILRVLALAGVTFAATWTSPAARAESGAEGAPTTITVAPPDSQPGKPVVIAATLVDNNSRAVGGVLLKFYVMTEVFGPKLMKIGEAATDSTGAATVTYKPTWTGDHGVSVRFAGTTQLAPSEGKGQFSYSGKVPVHKNAKFGLQTVRDWAPVAVTGLVVVIWATFIFVMVRVVVGVRSRAPTSERSVGRSIADEPALQGEAGKTRT